MNKNTSDIILKQSVLNNVMTRIITKFQADITGAGSSQVYFV